MKSVQFGLCSIRIFFLSFVLLFFLLLSVTIHKRASKYLSSYQAITLLLESERLYKLRLKLLATIAYLPHLPNTTTSHRFSFVRLPKCIRNEGCFIYFTGDWGKNNKENFHSVEIGNDIFIYINVKQVFFDSLIKSTVHLLMFRQNSMMFEESPNSLTKPYFTGELRKQIYIVTFVPWPICDILNRPVIKDRISARWSSLFIKLFAR